MEKDSTSAKVVEIDGHFFYCLIALVSLGLLTRALWPLPLQIWNYVFAHKYQLNLCALAGIVMGVGIGLGYLWNKYQERRSQSAVVEADETSIFLGLESKTEKKIYLKEDFRTAHTQVIGTTNAGKTASTILPWAAQDIEQGRGLLIMDGKAERSFLNQIYSHVVRHNRQSDFMVFSLANPYISSTCNPFSGGLPEQVSERVFSAFNINTPYYGDIQFEALRTVVDLLMRRGQVPMPGVIRELLRNKDKLRSWLPGLEDKNLASDLQAMLDVKDEKFEEKYSGLVTALGHFSKGMTARLFNTRNPEIDILDAIRRKKIIYFQLPTMQFPFLGAATGKLVLQTLESAASQIQVEGKRPSSLFSVYLDDFNDYLYPGFASLLNKSRSANIGVVFAHQSLGDLDKISPEFKQIVLTNTNIKVIMRSNDPVSAELFSKIIGTKTVERTTERRSREIFGERDTGEQSVREVEEYIIHPNVFKVGQRRGEGVVVIPHPEGRVVKQVEFSTAPELPTIAMPIRDLPELDLSAEAVNRGVVSVQVNGNPLKAA